MLDGRYWDLFQDQQNAFFYVEMNLKTGTLRQNPFPELLAIADLLNMEVQVVLDSQRSQTIHCFQPLNASRGVLRLILTGSFHFDALGGLDNNLIDTDF